VNCPWGLALAYGVVAVKRVASLADRTILRRVVDVVGSSRYIEYQVQSGDFEVYTSSVLSEVEAIEVESVAATGSKFNDVEKSQLLASIMSFLAHSRLFSSASSSSPNANLIWSALPSFPSGCSKKSIIIVISNNFTKIYRRKVESHGRSNGST
jgi:hypothetical protein